MRRLAVSGRAAACAAIAGTCTLHALPIPARAQDNYEIQVYGSETVVPGRTMLELHSNYTQAGRRDVEKGLLPTDHAWHETIEVTQGLTTWAELGFYTFTSFRSGLGWRWVGNHIRPRVRAPETWRWPVGASVSAEVGFQRREFSTDTWTLELRPIIDKQLGRWYAALNPTIDRALRGENTARGFEFSPNAAFGFDATSRVNIGVEYYGALGPVRRFDPIPQQQHQLFGAINLNVGPEWEINTGVGQTLTAAGDRRLVKLILGHRFGTPHSKLLKGLRTLPPESPSAALIRQAALPPVTCRGSLP